MKILILSLLLFLQISSQAANSQTVCESKGYDLPVRERSVVNLGSLTRIQKVLKKAGSGKDISIGAIGGSITMGALASKPGKRYINLTADWLSEKYPQIEVSLYNAGIGATDSKFGALRLEKHLLKYKPDIVIVEYSINDSANEIAEETFEGLIRQLLKSEIEPAVIILSMMNAYGKNVEEKHLPTAVHYQIPMLSFRSVFEPLLANNVIKPELILADSVHPNDQGHKAAAQIVTHFLAKASNLSYKKGYSDNVLPGPLYSDEFENVEFFEAGEIEVQSNQGWFLKDHSQSAKQPWRLHGRVLFEKVYNAQKPGAELEFEYTGSFLALTYWKEKADMGRVKVFIDGKEQALLDGWGPQEWGGYAQTDIIGGGLPLSKHHVRIVLSSESNQNSNGSSFELLTFGFGKGNNTGAAL